MKRLLKREEPWGFILEFHSLRCMIDLPCVNATQFAIVLETLRIQANKRLRLLLVRVLCIQHYYGAALALVYNTLYTIVKYTIVYTEHCTQSSERPRNFEFMRLLTGRVSAGVHILENNYLARLYKILYFGKTI